MSAPETPHDKLLRLAEENDFNIRLAASTFKLIRGAINAGAKVADEELAKNVAIAAAFRDDREQSPRDRLNAIKLLNEIAKMGIDLSMYINKNQRIDTGKPTEVVENRIFKVEFDQ